MKIFLHIWTADLNNDIGIIRKDPIETNENFSDNIALNKYVDDVICCIDEQMKCM